MNRPLNPQQVALAYRTDDGPATCCGRLGETDGVDGVYASFPVPGMARELMRYAEHGVCPGATLMALLCGDMMGAMTLGGDAIRSHLGDIAAWMYDNLPVAAQGSRAIIDRWLGMFQEPVSGTPTFESRPRASATFPATGKAA